MSDLAPDASNAADYWWDQRYQDMFFGIHNHFSDRPSSECSLCQEQEPTTGRTRT